jgi:hypothetical protein
MIKFSYQYTELWKIFLLSCWVKVHCGIYKSSYNVSNTSFLNSLFHSLFSSPHSWNGFNRYHFSINVHVYTVFALFSASYTLSPPALSSYWYQSPQTRPVLFSNKQYYENQAPLRGGHSGEREGKRRKLRRWIWLMYFLYKKEYRIFKPVEITIRWGVRPKGGK